MTWPQEYNRRRRRPVPDDWTEVAPTMRVTAAMRRYHVDSRILYRWEAESGVRCSRTEIERAEVAPVRTPIRFALEDWLHEYLRKQR